MKHIFFEFREIKVVGASGGAPLLSEGDSYLRADTITKVLSDLKAAVNYQGAYNDQSVIFTDDGRRYQCTEDVNTLITRLRNCLIEGGLA